LGAVANDGALFSEGSEQMKTHDDRIHELAARAWELARKDPVVAVQILIEWTGLSFDGAFDLIDEVMPAEVDQS
jgi:hypothetical protein